MTILDIIKSHGEFAHDGDPEKAAKKWEKYFQDPREVDAWLTARCYKPICAHDLKERGITPAKASMKVEYWGQMDTIGFHVSSKLMDYREATKLLLIKDEKPNTIKKCRPIHTHG